MAEGAEQPGGAPQGTPVAAGAGPGATRRAGEPTPKVLAKGLDGPDRSAPLSFSAPTADGDVERRTVLDGDGGSDGAVAKPASKARRKRDRKR